MISKSFKLNGCSSPVVDKVFRCSYSLLLEDRGYPRISARPSESINITRALIGIWYNQELETVMTNSSIAYKYHSGWAKSYFSSIKQQDRHFPMVKIDVTQSITTSTNHCGNRSMGKFDLTPVVAQVVIMATWMPPYVLPKTTATIPPPRVGLIIYLPPVI